MNRIARIFLTAITFSFVGLTCVINAGATTLIAPNLSLRNAPAQNAVIISSVAQGTTMNVSVCNSAWCYVDAGGQKGWVETKTLSPILANTNNQVRMMTNSASTGGAAMGRNTASAGLNISITITPEDQL